MSRGIRAFPALETLPASFWPLHDGATLHWRLTAVFQPTIARDSPGGAAKPALQPTPRHESMITNQDFRHRIPMPDHDRRRISCAGEAKQ
jgi:hypothetical protein